MSYTVTHRGRISGSVSDTVSYPASESGGSKSVTLNWSEDVTINVHVDTNPFDKSIGSCKTHLGALAAAVVATGVAHVKAKTESAQKISQAIIGGFHGLIRQELRQQMTELGAKIPMLLNELKRRATDCFGKREQMQMDFNRITLRNAELFSALDKNLEVGVRGLDQPVFDLFEQVRTATTSNVIGPLSSASLVLAGEIANGGSRLTVARIKGTAESIITSIQQNVRKSRQLGENLKNILASESSVQNGYVYAPVVVFEGDDIEDDACSQVSVCVPEPLSGSEVGKKVQSDLALFVTSANMRKLSPRAAADVDSFLKQCVSKWMSTRGEDQSKRVSDEMLRIWNANFVALNSYGKAGS